MKWQQVRWVLLLLFCHVGALGYLAYVHVPVCHEPVQLAGGIARWRYGTDAMCVNPPLPRLVATVSVVPLRPVLRAYKSSRLSIDRDEFAQATDFVEDNAAHLQQYIVLARWTCILFCIVGAIACWHWANAIYGFGAGIIALTLWCFCPVILGHGATIMADVPAAAMGIVAMNRFWAWLTKPVWFEAIIAGVAIGLAESCKFTLLVFYSMLPILWILYRLPDSEATTYRDWMRQAGMLVMVVLLSVYVINCVYLFDRTMTPLGEFRFQTKLLTGYDSLDEIPFEGANRFAGTWLGRLPVPVPFDVVQGVDTQRYDFEKGLPSYLRGQWAEHGWWYYYLYALLIKMPLGIWLLVVLAVGMSLRQWAVASGRWSVRRKAAVPFSPDDNRDNPRLPPPSPLMPIPWGEGRFVASWRDDLAVALPGLVILAFVSSQTGFSVHGRYAIPALPFLFVWTSKVGRVFERRSDDARLRRDMGNELVATCPHPITISERETGIVGWLRHRKRPELAALVVFVLTWSVVSSLSIYPHSLSYFNELAAVLPTPAVASYPKPKDAGDDNHGFLGMVKNVVAAGPRNGPQHLLDSNIDWGQDLFYLKDWLDSHPDVKLAGLAYSGSYPTKVLGLPDTLPPVLLPLAEKQEVAGRAVAAANGRTERQPSDRSGPMPGWYALSVNYLYDRSGQHRYFLHFTPVAMAGYSIYIYHITMEEANRLRRDFGLSELPLYGSEMPRGER